MLNWAAILLSCLVTGLVFIGLALVFVLTPSLGAAGAAGVAALVFILLGGLAGWLVWRRVVHLENWALERKDRAMQTLHDVRPLAKPVLIGGAAIAGLGLLRRILRR